MGKLLMILSVALVAYLYWMLFQQIQEDVNSLENSLGLLTPIPGPNREYNFGWC